MDHLAVVLRKIIKQSVCEYKGRVNDTRKQQQSFMNVRLHFLHFFPLSKGFAILSSPCTSFSLVMSYNLLAIISGEKLPSHSPALIPAACHIFLSRSPTGIRISMYKSDLSFLPSNLAPSPICVSTPLSVILYSSATINIQVQVLITSPR